MYYDEEDGTRVYTLKVLATHFGAAAACASCVGGGGRAVAPAGHTYGAAWLAAWRRPVLVASNYPTWELAAVVRGWALPAAWPAAAWRPCRRLPLTARTCLPCT